MANQTLSNMPLNGQFATRAVMSMAGLGVILMLSGCGGADPASMVPANFSNMANAGKINTELLDASILQTAQRINPFESQIPGQQLQVATADPGVDPTLTEGLPGIPELPAEAPKDPFAGLEVGGIVYRKTSPMAILRSSNTSTAGLGGVVRQGDTFMVDDVKVIVAKIDKNSITLKAPSLPSGSNSRILTVPSLIGYASTPSAASVSSTSSPKGAPRPGLEGADPNAVSEIDRMEGNIDVPQAILDLLKDKMSK